MSETGTTRSLVFERQMKHPPEKVWRALTQSHLIAEWLMENDFVPKVGHRFTFRATPLPGWSGIANCEVLAVDPPHLLSYRWGDGTESASGLVTVVTWTLMPRDGGTLVRMEQSGFRTPDELAFKRMGKGWPRVLERLEDVVGRVDLDA
ncbi:MAG TPA: SRPBCC domain-containing protein [Hyphomicrobiaceae bacterium]|jgi:uncharacterized protein YndB with AHSA1/START domain